MKVVEEKRGKVTVLFLEGRLDSNTSGEVESKIMDCFAAGEKNIVLDFSSLEYISSAGIRVLVHCHKEFEKQQGHIYLASVPKPVENILYITGFLPYFKVFDSSTHAAESLNT